MAAVSQGGGTQALWRSVAAIAIFRLTSGALMVH